MKSKVRFWSCGRAKCRRENSQTLLTFCVTRCRSAAPAFRRKSAKGSGDHISHEVPHRRECFWGGYPHFDNYLLIYSIQGKPPKLSGRRSQVHPRSDLILCPCSYSSVTSALEIRGTRPFGPRSTRHSCLSTHVVKTITRSWPTILYLTWT